MVDILKTATIKNIQKLLLNIEDENDPILLELEADTRKGVQLLLHKWKQKKNEEAERFQHYEAMKKYERQAREQGFRFIAGVDEVGRGPLAGPVVSAAVILKKESYIEGLDDSKKINGTLRAQLYNQIMNEAVSVGIGIISAEEIDKVNIFQATKKSMMAAVLDLKVKPDMLLIDAMQLNSMYPEQSIVKGDAQSVSIAAASIIAKVTRDNMMKEYHEKYPEYRFDLHMGYGTKKHIEAIETYGPCEIHRMTFGPVKMMHD